MTHAEMMMLDAPKPRTSFIKRVLLALGFNA